MKNIRIIFLALILNIVFPFKSLASDDNLENIKDIRGQVNYYDITEFAYPSKLRDNMPKNNKKNKVIRIDENNIIDDLEGKKFYFTGGAGGWINSFTFSKDGKFKGQLLDYDADAVYENDYDGEFVVDSKVNTTCYILKLVNPKITSPTGETFKAQSFGQDVTGHYVENATGFSKTSFLSPLPDNYHDEPFEFQDKFTLYTPFRQFDQMSDVLTDFLKRTMMPSGLGFESYQYIIVNNSTIEPFVEQIE